MILGQNPSPIIDRGHSLNMTSLPSRQYNQKKPQFRQKPTQRRDTSPQKSIIKHAKCIKYRKRQKNKRLIFISIQRRESTRKRKWWVGVPESKKRSRCQGAFFSPTIGRMSQKLNLLALYKNKMETPYVNVSHCVHLKKNENVER